jgi:hypothetical protein
LGAQTAVVPGESRGIATALKTGEPVRLQGISAESPETGALLAMQKVEGSNPSVGLGVMSRDMCPT